MSEKTLAVPIRKVTAENVGDVVTGKDRQQYVRGYLNRGFKVQISKCMLGNFILSEGEELVFSSDTYHPDAD